MGKGGRKEGVRSRRLFFSIHFFIPGFPEYFCDLQIKTGRRKKKTVPRSLIYQLNIYVRPRTLYQGSLQMKSVQLLPSPAAFCHTLMAGPTRNGSS
jgi:hypothetical protein